MNAFISILHIIALVLWWVDCFIIAVFVVGLVWNIYRNRVYGEQWAYCYTEKQKIVMWCVFGYFFGWVLTQ